MLSLFCYYFVTIERATGRQPPGDDFVLTEGEHMENKKIYTAPQMEITVFDYPDGTAQAVAPSGYERPA